MNKSRCCVLITFLSKTKNHQQLGDYSCPGMSQNLDMVYLTPPKTKIVSSEKKKLGWKTILQGTINHLWKMKIIFKSVLGRDMLVPRRICSFWNGPFEKVTSFVHFRGASFFSWQPRSFNLKPPQYKVGPSPNITRWAPSPVINGVNQKPISRIFSPQGNPFVRPVIRAITPFNNW